MIRFVVKNCGQTPAHSLTGWTEIAYGGPHRDSFAKGGTAEDFLAADLGPGQSMTLTIDVAPAQVPASKFWLFGEITYVDAFDAVHTTKIRTSTSVDHLNQIKDGRLNAEKGNRIG